MNARERGEGRPVEYWRSLAIDVPYAYEGPVPRSGERAWFRPPHASCWIVREGRATLNGSWDRWEIGPSEGLIIPSDFERGQRFEPRTTLLSVGLLTRGTGMFRRWPDLREPFVLTASAAGRLAGCMRRVIQHVERLGARPRGMDYFAYQAALMSLLARVEQEMGAARVSVPPPGRDPRVDAIAREVTDDPRMAQALPFARWRTDYGLSRAHIDRLFREQLGASPRAIRDEALTALAARLVSAGELSMKEVAARLGFRDASHFGRWFKRRTGLQPGATRRAEWA